MLKILFDIGVALTQSVILTNQQPPTHMKTSSNRPMTPSSIAAQRTKLETQLAALKVQEQAAEHHTKIITMVDELLTNVQTLTGKPMTIADLAKLKRGKVTRATRTPSADKAKRLSEDQIKDLTKRLTIRATHIAAGRPAEQITVIADAFDVSPQTVQAWEKKRIAAEQTKQAARAEFEKGQQANAPVDQAPVPATESPAPETPAPTTEVSAPAPEVAATV